MDIANLPQVHTLKLLAYHVLLDQDRNRVPRNLREVDGYCHSITKRTALQAPLHEGVEKGRVPDLGSLQGGRVEPNIR